MVSLQLVYQRITLNKISLSFFLFSFVHCFAQGILHSFLYSVDLDSRTLVSSIVQMAEVPQREIAWLTGDTEHFVLHLCTNVPFEQLVNSCIIIYDSDQGNMSIPIPVGFRRLADSSFPNLPSTRRFPVRGEISPQTSLNSWGEIDGVNMSMSSGSTVTLNNQCTRLLVYPNQIFKDFVREDAVLIAIQFWLFSISFFAIIYESIPHILSVLVARVLVTNWAAFTTWRTGHIQIYIQRFLTGDDSPCQVDLFPTYFQTRTSFEIPNLVLNSVGLLLAIFFSFKLLKMYNAQTFKSIGPPQEIVRIYRVFQAFFVCLQLSVFCLVTAMALWINEIVNGAIAVLSMHTAAYIGLFIGSTILLVPWISMGWFAVRREMKKLMAAFLILGFLYIAAWATMFYSLEYRWTFIRWPFFAALTAEAFVVMIASCVLGVTCRRNFDKGLAHYLYVENVLGNDDFEPELFPHDVEKSSPDVLQKQVRGYSTEDLKEFVL